LKPASSAKTVLSLDGGGSHLMIQLGVLACLEDDTGASTYDLFDLIAGSSSGGLITCLILGRQFSANRIIKKILQEKLLQEIMAEQRFGRWLRTLQIRPKYQGIPKRLVLQRELGDVKLSSLAKRIFIPCFNLSQDQLEIFTNGSQPDFLLSEIADACTAAPSYFPPVQMQDGDWRIDGGVGMNNPGFSAYLHAQRCWHQYDIKLLSIGSGWRSFAINGAKASRYGGLQWSAQGIASIILREKMLSNVKTTAEVLGDQVLYINHYLKDFDMPDHMDSANNAIVQQKALEIGKRWYTQQREQILALLQSR
jgi:predicted acylesterase/phospholipase RssA